MKKKIIFAIVLLACTLPTFSQNVQLHFDPRRGLHSDDFNRNYLTATFEMFKPDKWGSTFMFVDLDFNQTKGNLGLAYMEIARDQKIGNLPVMAHIEYNGGLVRDEAFNGFSIPNAYLAGASYATNIVGVNLSTYIAYKYHAFDRVSNDVQWTFTWSRNFCDGKITLSGFFDLWTENKNRFKGNGESGKKIVVLTEPQFWYNVTSSLSLGTEVEISDNFLQDKTYVNPTIAAKWNF